MCISFFCIFQKRKNENMLGVTPILLYLFYFVSFIVIYHFIFKCFYCLNICTNITLLSV